MISSSHQHNHVLAKTVLLSLLLHATGIYFIPKIDFTPEQPPKILTVELAPPPPPQPPKPEPEPPQPVKPVPVKPPTIQPVVKKIVTPVVEKTRDTPVVTEPPVPVIANPVKTETAAPVVPPAPVEPPAPPPPPPPPSNVDYDALSNQYAKLISREVAKYKQYPKIAQMRNWQGEAIIQIIVSPSGKVLESKVQTSSGFEVLDKQALKMVNEANLPLPPEAIRNKPISILIPISFKLE